MSCLYAITSHIVPSFTFLFPISLPLVMQAHLHRVTIPPWSFFPFISVWSLLSKPWQMPLWVSAFGDCPRCQEYNKSSPATGFPSWNQHTIPIHPKVPHHHKGEEWEALHLSSMVSCQFISPQWLIPKLHPHRADVYPQLNDFEERIFCSFLKLHDALSYMISEPDMWGDHCIIAASTIPIGFVNSSQIPPHTGQLHCSPVR